MRLIKTLSEGQVVSLGVILTLFLGFLFLGSKDFFLDEIASLLIVKNTATLFHFIWHNEGNMWLYYFLLFFWAKLGTSETVIRSLSVIFAACSIPGVYFLTKELLGQKAAKIMLILLPLHVFFISNAQNARSYSLLLFLTSLASLFFVRLIKTSKKRFLLYYGILMSLAIYSHIYAVFVLLAQLFSFLILSPKKALKTSLLLFPLILLLVLPLVTSPAFHTHSQNIQWIPKPGVRNVIGTYILLSNDFLPQALLNGLLILSLMLTTLKQNVFTRQYVKNNWNLLYIISGVILPILTAFVVSYVMMPLYTSTYFNIALVPFLMLIVLALQIVKRKWLYYLAVALTIAFSLIRVSGYYAQIPALSLGISNNNDEWKKTAQFLLNNTKRSDAVIFYPTYGETNVEVYVPKNISANYTPINLQPDPFSGGNKETTFNEPLLLSIPHTYRNVWFVLNEYTDDTRLEKQREIEDMLKLNYHEVSEKDYFRIKIYHYEK